MTSSSRPRPNQPRRPWQFETSPLSLNKSKLAWYLRRFRTMSVPEVAWRLEDQAKKWAWRPEQVTEGDEQPGRRRPRASASPTLRGPIGQLRFELTLPKGALLQVPQDARKASIAAADELLAGHWVLLGVQRKDIDDPDWFFDPVTARNAPRSPYCFSIDYRSQDVTGNVKQLWELSRLQHVTVLAAAYALSGDERYAERAARDLRSWWANNPFLSGVHWTSGIELGLRLISWVWARRLLEGWAGTGELFEGNKDALSQIWWHQRYLARFHGRGSSANNHVIAEASGQLVASLAFDWFEESGRWAAEARALLDQELVRNTFPSGVNREMASEYHGFVAELGLLAAVEADRAGQPLSRGTWHVLRRMTDVVAATSDIKLHPPRQGDGDDGKGLLLGPPEANRWESLLALGAKLFGAPDWWPPSEPDTASVLMASIANEHRDFPAPPRRPSHFADAGLTILRSRDVDGPEIWCRCDAGPHGFLSIAAHAHADALSIEVRYDGTEILADPGTYCYHVEPDWRRYFRSTLGHNTVEIAHQDQSEPGGPTMWTRHANSRLVEVGFDQHGEANVWSAEHDGYEALEPPARHRRSVKLLGPERRVEILDVVETGGPQAVRIAFHLGPEVNAELTTGNLVQLAWVGQAEDQVTASLQLPDGLVWSQWRGATDPILGWYSARFGEKQPSTTIIGEGTVAGRAEFPTTLQFSS